MAFEHLFTPIRVGRMELSNRIVMPPMATNFADKDGFVTDQLIAYYRERARGGVGYITIEHTGIRQDGKAFPTMLMAATDEHTPGLKRLVEAIHEAGGKVVIQINHAGRQTASATTGREIVAPSAIRCPLRQEVPRELTADEVLELIEDFGRAAERVRAAGADGVELHMAHGYLLNQFFSPLVNKRSDAFGGSPEKRMAAPLAVLKRVREKLGNDFPVICRISADEYMPGGLTLEDSREFARALEKCGADAIHVSACQSSSPFPLIPHYYIPEGAFVHLAEGIKSVVSIPVIAVGRIRTPELADRIIAEGRADLVSMGRALIADPAMPNKAREGRAEDINPCISCNRCSLSLVAVGSVRCSVNPEVSRESWMKIEGRSSSGKKVWVVGGGPAGMKVAQVCALRGHEVHLFEKDDKLGGRFILAALPPDKGVLAEFTGFLIRQVEQLDVQVHLGQGFSPKLMDADEPDVVFLATGANTRVPNLCSGIEALTDEDVLAGKVKTGQKVLIVGGGGIGSETANFLADEGKSVTLLEMREEIALDMHPAIRGFLRKRLQGKGIDILTSTKALAFDDDCLLVEGPDGQGRIEGFDTVVVSLGAAPNLGLEEEVRKRGGRVVVVGDAKEPRALMEALCDAEEAALAV